MTIAGPVLVTGAGGFVCRIIVQALLETGSDVIAIDQSFDDSLRQEWESWGSRLNLIESDVEHLPPLHADAVVHGAAVTASPEAIGQLPEENFRANLNPTLEALEWARRQAVRRFLFISSSAVYRETLPGPVSETLPTSPLGIYAAAKQAAESLIETLHVVYGRDIAIVRLSNIYGPAEHIRPTRPRMSLVGNMIQTALRTGKLVVYRDSPARDWTYAPDVGKAISRMLASPVLPHHLYHVASGQTLTPIEIAETIQSLLPHVGLDIRAGDDPYAVPLLRRGTLSAERLRQDVGFDEWTSFEDGIKQVMDRERSWESAR